MCSNNYICDIENIEAKVKYIKNRIENGTYFVDSDNLALSLIENVSDLLFDKSNDLD